MAGEYTSQVFAAAAQLRAAGLSKPALDVLAVLSEQTHRGRRVSACAQTKLVAFVGSVNSVRRGLAQLQEWGLVRVVSAARPGRVTEYELSTLDPATGSLRLDRATPNGYPQWVPIPVDNSANGYPQWVPISEGDAANGYPHRAPIVANGYPQWHERVPTVGTPPVVPEVPGGARTPARAPAREGHAPHQLPLMASVPNGPAEAPDLQPCGQSHDPQRPCRRCGAARQHADTERLTDHLRVRACPMCDAAGVLLEVGRFLPVSPPSSCDHTTEHHTQVTRARGETA